MNASIIFILLLTGILAASGQDKKEPHAYWDFDKEEVPLVEVVDIPVYQCIQTFIDEANHRHPDKLAIKLVKAPDYSGKQNWDTGKITELKLHHVSLSTALRYACESTGIQWRYAGSSVVLYPLILANAEFPMTPRIAAAIGLDPENWTTEQIRDKLRKAGHEDIASECFHSKGFIYFEEVNQIQLEKIQALIRLWQDGYVVTKITSEATKP